MTIFDLRCDRCGALVSGPAAAQRFVYHPGDPALADNSSLACRGCWSEVVAWLGPADGDGCSLCGISESPMLWVQRRQDHAWRLCKEHAVEFLNGLRTVDPKLELETFQWPTDRSSGDVG